MKSSQYSEGPEADPDCMDGYIKYDDACYLVMNSAMTRSQAAEACQNEGKDVKKKLLKFCIIERCIL